MVFRSMFGNNWVRVKKVNRLINIFLDGAVNLDYNKNIKSRMISIKLTTDKNKFWNLFIISNILKNVKSNQRKNKHVLNMSIPSNLFVISATSS